MKTHIPKGEQTIEFESRNMLKSLHDRLRVYAAVKRITLEQAVNEAVAVGLPTVERQAGITARQQARRGEGA